MADNTATVTASSASVEDEARRIARILLKVGAVQINTRELFTYVSGIKSPIYCDNRLIISYPDEREVISEGLAQRVVSQTGGAGVDVIAGTATAAIPWAAWVAAHLHLPMVYVRSSAKDHGLGNQVEGRLMPGQSVMVVEDLITTGGSALSTVGALREAGASVAGCVAIFTYGRAKATNAFVAEKLGLATLSDIQTLLSVAVDEGQLTSEQQDEVRAWLATG